MPVPNYDWTSLVDDYSDRYDPDTHMDRWYTDATAQAIVKHIKPGDLVLELGCATGRMTEVFAAAGAVVVGVDRSPAYLARARERVPAARFVEGDVEDPVSCPPMDHVVATNLVHELDDPAGFFKLAAGWLAPGGMLHVSLQNPYSLHRLVGRGDPFAVTPEGRSLGTRSLFDVETLFAWADAAGLWLTAEVEGVMLKPYPNAVMAQLPDALLRELVEAGRAMPKRCSMNYLRFARTPMLAHSSGSSSTVTSASTSAAG